jgi:hypothetical protein
MRRKVRIVAYDRAAFQPGQCRNSPKKRIMGGLNAAPLKNV